MYIETISDFRKAIRQGAYVWPGGYPLYFVMADGACLSFKAAKAHRRDILEALRDRAGRPGFRTHDGWLPASTEVNWEDGDLYCDATGERIESAYAEPEENDPKPFKVEGVEEDGSRTELAAFDNSGEARAFLNRYTRSEDAGGWGLIEVYDTRGSDPERLWFWEREAD